MMFDKIIEVPKGDYHRGSITIALVGSMRVEIGWAANALSVQLPINANRALYTYPHPNLDVARNLALSDWLKEAQKLPAWKTSEHIFLWPSNEYIKWNTIQEALGMSGPVVRIGNCYSIRRDGLDPDGAPWFKEGKWTGPDPVVAERFQSTATEYVDQKERQDPVEADEENLFVTCLPSLGHTSLAWVSHVLQLASPVGCVRVLAMAIGREVADARTQLIESCLRVRPRPAHVFFLGDDMLPEANSLQLIWETMRKHNSPSACGLYHMKYYPPAQPLMWLNGKPGWLIAGRDYKVGDPVWCDGSGLDFVMFRTDVFEKIPKPWFKTGMEWVEGKGIFIHTEDAHFWHRYREATGFQTLVDTRARIAHYNSFDQACY